MDEILVVGHARDLTLYQIESELLQLIEFRDETEADKDITSAERLETLAAVDGQIADYVGRELAKVDGIAYHLREFEARSNTLKEESRRIAERGRVWQARYERLRYAAEQALLRSGKTKIEGETNTLSIQRNAASVDVAQPDLVPMELRRVSFSVTEQTYRDICTVLFEARRNDLFAAVMENGEVKGEPMKTEIGAILKCAECKGGGKKGKKDCETCKGTGQSGRGVPGCRLVNDRYSLRLK